VEQYQGQPVDLKPFKTNFIVCAAITMILPLITFVLWVMISGSGADYASDVTPVHLAMFTVLGAAAFVMAPLVRQWMLAKTGPVRTNVGTMVEGDPAAWYRIGMAAVVGMALPETTLLSGFVLAFLAMSWVYYVPFALATVIGWAFMYPRPSQVRAWYAHQMGYDTVPGMVN